MDISPELLKTAKEILKIIPGLIALPFSIYFAWKKINHKILAYITVGHDRLSATRISNIVLSNLKDKPVPIFSIYAIIDRDISVEVEKFDPPLILKGLESLSINTSPVSSYFIGAENYEPRFMPPQELELYLVSTGKPIKCKISTPPSIQSLKELSKYSMATARTKRFNGFVYNESLAYAIIYHTEGQHKTAFIERSGFICKEWQYQYNMIPAEKMRNADGVREFIRHCGYDKIFTNYSVIPVSEM